MQISFTKLVHHQEEMYEWGNPKAGLHETGNEMAEVAYRWRKKLMTDPHSNPTTGAFHDFSVILAQNGKREQLSALIKAGGGALIEAT